MLCFGLFQYMVTFVYFNCSFHATFGVPIWLNKNVDFNGAPYQDPVYNQLHTFNLYSRFEIFFSVTGKLLILYISCIQAIYFSFLDPASIFFNIFHTPLQKNNGPSFTAL